MPRLPCFQATEECQTAACETADQFIQVYHPPSQATAKTFKWIYDAYRRWEMGEKGAVNVLHRIQCRHFAAVVNSVLCEYSYTAFSSWLHKTAGTTQHEGAKLLKLSRHSLSNGVEQRGELKKRGRINKVSPFAKVERVGVSSNYKIHDSSKNSSGVWGSLAAESGV
ncbi:hypothetical protein BaRGS_00032832 [Batillaria attramentaria]|uniref:Uncharacterized protein n=1 Tax=Batillaria attramentaria TaxID=370345 RepID=A0ABD0JLP4_9CAEN